MFGKKKTTTVSQDNNLPVSSGAINSLVTGTSIEGTINADSDIRIDGSIKGSLKCSGRVIIGQQGSVNGEIDCQNAVIEGRFDGKLQVAETLSVKETAKVTGDINTQKLMVQHGAVFNDNCIMGGHKLKSINELENKTNSGVAK